MIVQNFKLNILIMEDILELDNFLAELNYRIKDCNQELIRLDFINGLFTAHLKEIVG